MAPTRPRLHLWGVSTSRTLRALWALHQKRAQAAVDKLAENEGFPVQTAAIVGNEEFRAKALGAQRAFELPLRAPDLVSVGVHGLSTSGAVIINQRRPA